MDPSPTKMFLLSACVCVGLVLLLLPRTHQSCTVGTAGQCKRAEFAPGTNLAGEGFDITQMKRKGAYVIDMNLWKNKDNTCNVCANPYAGGKMQKLPLSVVDWRPSHACTMKVSSTLHRSSESLLNSGGSTVENNWQVNLDFDVAKKSGNLILAGTHSQLAEYSMEKTKNDKFSFTSQGMTCQYYR